MEDVPRTANEPRQVAASLGGCLTEGSKGRRIVAIPCAGRSEPEIRTELRLWISRRNRRRQVSHLVAGTAGVSVTGTSRQFLKLSDLTDRSQPPKLFVQWFLNKYISCVFLNIS